MVQLTQQGTIKGQRSLTKNILVLIVAVVAVVSVSSLLINLLVITQDNNRQLRGKINDHLIYLQKSLAVPLWNYDLWPIRALGRAMIANDDVVFLSIWDDDGNVIFDERKKQVSAQIEKSEEIMYRGRSVGSFQLGLTDVQYLQHRRQIVIINLVTSLVTIFCLLAVVMIFVRRLIMQPLQLFSKRLATIARGEYETYGKNVHPSELNAILENFNHMAIEIANRERTLLETNKRFEIEIEERKKTEKLLRTSERKYRQLIENAIDAIFIAQDGLLKFTNQKALDLLGYSIDELHSISFLEFIHPDDREMVVGNYLKRIKGDTDVPGNYTFVMVTKNRLEIIVQISSILVDWEGKPATLNFVRDISEQKKLEESFYQAQKLEAIGTLAGGIAHDFNNLLMGIQGRSSLLAVSLSSTDVRHEHIKAIDEYVSSATSLTSQLLGTARGGKYESKPIDINELIRQSSSMFGRTKKEIKIVTEIAEESIVVDVDRQQIEQVLLNMYLNAWQAMSDGGELRLGSLVMRLGRSYCAAHNVCPGEYVRVSVTDNGSGMDDIIRSQIFDPFFTTKEMGRGTGLGLASAYGIIKNHGGFITVYSEVDQGTTFNIYLPLSDKTAHGEDPVQLEITKGYETILLVDDEKMILEVSQALLQEIGYKVISAEGGEEAVRILEEQGDSIHLVILDLIMPGMDGGKTFDSIRNINPRLPVILSSGYALNTQATEILSKGCRGFIQKPFSMADLSRKVRTVLDSSQSE